MKKILLRNVLICIAAIIVIAAGGFFALGYYYQQGFTVNTWVNDVYCTGMTADEVNKELLRDAEAPFITVKAVSGEEYRLTGAEAGMTMDYSEQLRKLFEEQKNADWYTYFDGSQHIELIPELSCNLDAVKAWVETLPFVQEETAGEAVLEIRMTEEGYVLTDTLKNRLNMDVLLNFVTEKLESREFLSVGAESGSMVLDLAEADCYGDIPLTDEQKAELQIWDTIKPFVQCPIVYDMGDERIPLAGKIASSFLAMDENGDFLFDKSGVPIIDENAVEAFIDELAEEYNTYKTDLTFTATSGEFKTVPYLNYGTELDVKKEKQYLKEALRENAEQIHIPSYKREGYVRGKDDIGDTYIEVDMGDQKLYAYLDGELLAETDIVTGNERRKMLTPEGVVYVYKKQRNRTLRGPGYASFVRYWMPVKGGIGLHDANWRKEFGGEIYKKNGSHGCINIPRTVMKDIYENFEVGTPVVMFY